VKRIHQEITTTAMRNVSVCLYRSYETVQHPSLYALSNAWV